MGFRSARRRTTWSNNLATPFFAEITVPLLSRIVVTAKPTELDEAEASTIVRTHLSLSVRPTDTIQSVAEPWAFGLTLISDQAAAVGATAVASPSLDDADWFMFGHGFTTPNGQVNQIGRAHV